MDCNRCAYHVKEKDSHGNVACLVRTVKTHGFSLEPFVMVPSQTDCNLGVLPQKEIIPKAAPYNRKDYKMQFGKKGKENGR